MLSLRNDGILILLTVIFNKIHQTIARVYCLIGTISTFIKVMAMGNGKRGRSTNLILYIGGLLILAGIITYIWIKYNLF